VMILDLPPEFLARLPTRDTQYDMTVLQPMFQLPIVAVISKDDLMGGMLRPKSTGGQLLDKSGGDTPGNVRAGPLKDPLS
jgi:hypothetical protein